MCVYEHVCVRCARACAHYTRARARITRARALCAHYACNGCAMACGYVLCVCASTLTLLHLINSIFWDRSLDEQLYTCMKPHICARGRAREGARVCARALEHISVCVCVCAQNMYSQCVHSKSTWEHVV